MTELLSASGPTPLPDDHASSSTPPMQHTSRNSPQVDVPPSTSLKVKSKGGGSQLVRLPLRGSQKGQPAASWLPLRGSQHKL